MLKMSQSNVQISKETRLLITCDTLNSRPRSDCSVSGRPEGWRLCVQWCFGFVCGPVAR